MLRRGSMIFAFILAVSAAALGQDQKLKVFIKGGKDTTYNLARYYGDKIYYADTAELKGGWLEYDMAKHLPGMYALVVDKDHFIQLLHNGEKLIEIKTTAANPNNDMEVVKSEENKEFYRYIRYIGSKSPQAQALGKQLQSMQDKESAQYKQVQDKITALNDEVLNFQKEFLEKNKDMYVGALIAMTIDVKLPEDPVAAGIDTTVDHWQYYYIRDHYFDNVDFTDDRIVRTQMFHSRLDNYLDKVVAQNPDTIIRYLDPILSTIKPGSDMFKFVVHHLANKYESSKIMCMDKVFAHVGKRFYCKGLADWMDQEGQDKVCERAETLWPLSCGMMPPNISLVDSTEQKWHNFYGLKNKYVVLYFWDPNCGHCKKETPKLAKVYKQSLKDLDVEVFAVSRAMGDDFEAWKKFIKKHDLDWINVGVTPRIFEIANDPSRQREIIPRYTDAKSLNYQQTYDIFSTPRVFVLDKDKKIIGKQMSVEQLEDMIRAMEGLEPIKRAPKEEKDEDEDDHGH